MQISIYRYNPDVDEVPSMREMEVDLPEGKDLMVLDVLELMKTQDSTLSYRRSCREGVCGSREIAKSRRPREAGWSLRVYLVCLLFYFVSVFLVEP